jgi:hypothetical protein
MAKCGQVLLHMTDDTVSKRGVTVMIVKACSDVTMATKLSTTNLQNVKCQYCLAQSPPLRIHLKYSIHVSVLIGIEVGNSAN